MRINTILKYNIVLLFSVLMGASSTLSAQCTSVFSDDFSSGLTQWQNTADWTTISNELKHNLSSVAGESYLVTDFGSQNFTSGDYEWSFCMRNGSWTPSGNNNFEFILFSDTSNLGSSVNGYSIGINQIGTLEEITLYKLSLGSHTEILKVSASNYSWLASHQVCIRVTRTNTGDWSLYYDENGNGEQLAGTANETTWTSGQFLGPVFTFTSTRAGLFYADDVAFCMGSGTGNTSISGFTFSDYPAGCIAKDNPFSVKVCALNQMGQVDTTFNDTILLEESTGMAMLSGTTLLPLTQGCAVLNDLQFDQIGTFQIKASQDTIFTNSNDLIIEEACESLDTLLVMTYNLLNFPDENSCNSDIQLSDRQDTLRKILDYIQPDIFMVCELQNVAGADLILNSSLNHSGETKYKRADFVTNGSGGGFDLNNMIFYNSEKVELKYQSRISTTTRDVSRYVIYGHDPNIAVHDDTTYIDFYQTHFKAGSDASNQTRRATDANFIKTYMINNSNGYDVFGGDLNLYTDQEDAYQTLCKDAGHPFNDPIQREGSWSANPTYANVHTQSTRAFSTTPIECGSTGGVDDRFDFLLVSDSLLSSTSRVHYVESSYEAIGNNGSTYNKSINDASNTVNVPSNILNSLYYMSDHLPVVMKLAIVYPGHVDHTGISSSITNEKRELKIYPNPSQGHKRLHVLMPKEVNQSVHASIYDLTGRKVWEQNFPAQQPIEFETRFLNEGQYVLRINDTDQSYYQHFIIKK